jgi:hypothetical protein
VARPVPGKRLLYRRVYSPVGDGLLELIDFHSLCRGRTDLVLHKTSLSRRPRNCNAAKIIRPRRSCCTSGRAPLDLCGEREEILLRIATNPLTAAETSRLSSATALLGFRHHACILM